MNSDEDYDTGYREGYGAGLTEGKQLSRETLENFVKAVNAGDWMHASVVMNRLLKEAGSNEIWREA